MSGTIAEIELVVWDVLDRIDQRTLVEIPLPFGRAACRGDRWRPGRPTDVGEDALYCRAVDDRSNDPHLCPAVWADQRQYFVNSGQ